MIKNCKFSSLKVLDLTKCMVNDDAIQALSQTRQLAMLEKIVLNSCGLLTEKSIFYLLNSDLLNNLYSISIQNTKIFFEDLLFINSGTLS